MLTHTSELFVYFTEGTFEAPWIDGEHCTRVPHFAHCLAEWKHKVSILSHDVVWVDLILVGRTLFVSEYLISRQVFIFFQVLRKVSDACEEVSNVRSVGNALHGRVHVASISKVGTAFSS